MNNGKYAIDAERAGKTGLDDLLNNNTPGGVIRLNGNPNEL